MLRDVSSTRYSRTIPQMLLLASLLASGRPADAQESVSFDTASVRQNVAGENATGADAPYVNFPIGSDDAFYDTGGVFLARNLPLVSYLIFAYKINTNNRQALLNTLPEWAKSEHFNIEARTDLTSVSKDQMRAMMATLLKERFALSVHEENKIVPVFAAVLDKESSLGPQLRAHPKDAACAITGPTPNQVAAATTSASGFPAVCGRFANAMKSDLPSHRRVGGGQLPMAKILSSFTGVGDLGKPVIDQTGLVGDYDFFIDFAPEVSPEAPPGSAVVGPTFVGAVRKQLGIRLAPDRAPITFVLVDHIEHAGPQEEH